ncbi:MAG: hypothetical protein ACRCS4_08025, partial [Flavobacterium sp.]
MKLIIDKQFLLHIGMLFKYSAQNTLSILEQNPTATLVATADKWSKLGINPKLLAVGIRADGLETYFDITEMEVDETRL